MCRSFKVQARKIIAVGLFLWICIAFNGVSWGIAGTSAQDHFSWRNDDGSETTATWKAATDTSISSVNDGDKLRIRISFNSAGGSSTLTPRLEFSSDATSCTTGTWTATTTATIWKNFDSSQYGEPVATTKQISAPASFLSGSLLDLTNPAGSSITLATQGTEYEWAVQANGTAGSTTYRFRITNNGTVLGYSACPSLTTSAGTASTGAPSSFFHAL